MPIFRRRVRQVLFVADVGYGCNFKHEVRWPFRLAGKPHTYVRSFRCGTSSRNCCGCPPRGFNRTRGIRIRVLCSEGTLAPLPFKHEFAGEMLAALPDSREIQDAATDSPAREHRAIGLWMRLDFSAVGVAECVFAGAGLSEETAEL